MFVCESTVLPREKINFVGASYRLHSSKSILNLTCLVPFSSCIPSSDIRFDSGFRLVTSCRAAPYQPLSTAVLKMTDLNSSSSRTASRRCRCFRQVWNRYQNYFSRPVARLFRWDLGILLRCFSGHGPQLTLVDLSPNPCKIR